MIVKKKAWIWKALKRVNGFNVALRKSVRRKAMYQPMHGYRQFSSFSFHTHFLIFPFCLYTYDSSLFSSHSQPFSSNVGFAPTTMIRPSFLYHPFSFIAGFAPTPMICPSFSFYPFFFLEFILSHLPELRKASLTHRLGQTVASERWRLGQTGASERGKEMIEKNIAWNW